MSTPLTLETLQKELEATQYWLRYLFVMATSRDFMTAKSITDQIQAIKNQDPGEFPHFAPGEFDRRQLELVPYVERLGAISRNISANSNKGRAEPMTTDDQRAGPRERAGSRRPAVEA